MFALLIKVLTRYNNFIELIFFYEIEIKKLYTMERMMYLECVTDVSRIERNDHVTNISQCLCLIKIAYYRSFIIVYKCNNRILKFH